MPIAEELVQEIRNTVAGGKAPERQLKEALWNSCLDVVSGLAARYTRFAPQYREDFVGEAYLKFEQLLRTYDPQRGVPFRAYLAGCVERHFHDQLRKRTERPGDAADERPCPAPSAYARLVADEVADRVEAVLAELLPRDPQRERKILAFRLRHLEGWPVEKIRDLLGVERANTVSQWIHRVLAAFEEEFPRRYPDYFRGRRELDLDE